MELLIYLVCGLINYLIFKFYVHVDEENTWSNVLARIALFVSGYFGSLYLITGFILYLFVILLEKLQKIIKNIKPPKWL